MKPFQLIFLVLLGFFQTEMLVAQAFLSRPIEVNNEDDFVIVNYVDWELVGYKDAYCGSKSYDGHQGTDFSLKSFTKMDSGVYVLAAANGRVTFTQDGIFDRETVSDVQKGLGNYIAIRHPNKYYTYYGHLMKGSLLVSKGDSVVAGQRIAKIGSSGNSTDPHLHFELWYDSSYVVDPFKGDCGNPNSLWLQEEKYDTSLQVWEYGITDKTVGIDSLRFRNIDRSGNFKFEPTANDSLWFWAQLQGLRTGDSLEIRWFTPQNQLWFSFAIELKRDWWYYYFWSFIDHQNLETGTWKAELYRNGTQVIRQEFLIQKKAGLSTRILARECPSLNPEERTQLLKDPNTILYDLRGSRLPQYSSANSPKYHIPEGLYLIEYPSKSGYTCRTKWGVR